MFADLGVPIIDTDVIARALVQPGQPALEEIRSKFGSEVIDADGMLDRASLRNIVFADDEARSALESILHPRIREATVRMADDAEGPYQVIVVPLLVESPTRAFVDRVLVVDCDEDTQIARLLARDTETKEQAQRMLAAQSSRADRLAIADDVVTNDGDLQEVRDQVLSLHQAYLRRAAEHNK